MIVVDGASSSGKTSLLRAFTGLATERYRSCSIDEFLPSLPIGVFAARAGTDDGWVTICADFHRHLVHLRSSSDRMIAEVMLPWPEAREDLFRVVGRENMYYVQLFCTLEELQRRERQRGDRRQGLARSQFDRVYAFHGYDLQIDSTSRTPEECAQLVAGQAI